MGIDEIGQRVAALRVARGLTQADLARVIDRDPTVITKLEAGQRRLNSYELALIAEALNTTADELLGRGRSSSPMRLAARIAHVPYPPEVQVAVGRVRRLFELEALLDRIAPGGKKIAPLQLSPPVGGLPRHQGESLAGEVRRLLEIGDHPIGDLPQLIEDRLGMDVAIEPLPDGVDGVCVQVDGSALAMANAAQFPGRRRFTIAHEVCHFLSGDGQDLVVERPFSGSNSPEEVRANAFAAHFLMPKTAIARFLGTERVTERAVAQIMFTFGASLQAVAWHLFNLRKITVDERERLLSFKPGSLFHLAGLRAEWQAAEQTLDVVRPPARLQERAIAAYTKGNIGIGPLADLFGTSDAEKLREELARQGISPPAYDLSPAVP